MHFVVFFDWNSKAKVKCFSLKNVFEKVSIWIRLQSTLLTFDIAEWIAFWFSIGFKHVVFSVLLTFYNFQYTFYCHVTIVKYKWRFHINNNAPLRYRNLTFTFCLARHNAKIILYTFTKSVHQYQYRTTVTNVFRQGFYNVRQAK